MNYEELQRILVNEDKPSTILRSRREELAELIPEIRETFDFDQQTEWHQYDVFEHTLHVVDETEPNYLVRLAALFHDIGKPRMMYLDENGEGHFHYHWEESEKIFIDYQNKLNLSEEDIYLVRKLIYYHDLTIKNQTLHLFLEEFDEEGLKMLMDLKQADAKAHSEKFVPDRLAALEDSKKRLNMERERLGMKKINFNEDSKVKITTSDVEDDKFLLLAILCNNSQEFTFKSMNNSNEEFIVGLSTLGGILKYPVPMEYWDYFDIPELDNLPNMEASSNREKIDKLKSMFSKNNKVRGK